MPAPRAAKGNIAYLTLQATAEGQAAHAHVHEIIRGLQDLGWSVDLYEPAYASSTPPGVRARLVEFVRLQRALAARIGEYDIVYVRAHPFALLAARAAQRAGVPVVQEVNGPTEDLFTAWPAARAGRPLFEWSQRAQYRFSDALIAVTPELAEWLQHQSGRRDAVVIPNGANTDRFMPGLTPLPGLPEDYALFFGALAPWQGISAVLEAACSLAWPADLPLVIAGDGTLRRDVETATVANPIIRYTGVIPYADMPRAVSNATAVISTQTPQAEGRRSVSPIKLYESMSSGVPVIVSDLPGLADEVTTTNCGLVVPVGDAEAIAASVALIAADPDAAREMGLRGRAAAEQRHSWTARAAATDALLKRVVDAGRSTDPAPAQQDSAHIVMLVANDVVHDARVRKEARSASEAGYRVTVLGVRTPSAPDDEMWEAEGARVRIRRLADSLRGRGGNALFRKARNYRDMRRIQQDLARAAVAEAPDLIHANDLDTLPAAITAKRSLGVPVLYDAHELYAEQFDRPDARTLERALVWAQKLVLTHQEASLIRQADAVVTVNPFIAEELRQRYGIPTPSVVLNAPPVQNVEPLPLPDLPRPIFIYQGGLDRGRGLLEILEAFATSDGGSLVVMGSGVLREAIAERAQLPDLAGRVVVLDPVPQAEVVRAAASADVGLIPYQPDSLNNYYASPNKLFDYMHAGIAIVATDLPYLTSVLMQTGAGIVVEPGSTTALAVAISDLVANPSRLEAMRAASATAAQRYTWEEQVATLLAAYDRLTAASGIAQ